MRPILLLLLATAAWADPVLSFVTFGTPSPTSLRGDWITDINASHDLRWSEVSGQYSGACLSASPPTCGVANRSGSVGWDKTHSVVADGVKPATLYYMKACSTNPGELCSSESSVTTGAAVSLPQDPVAPTAVDDSWTAGTGTEQTVSNAYCSDLAAKFGALATNGKLVIPHAALTCSGAKMIMTAAKTNMWVTSDCPAKPANTRPSLTDCHATVYKSFFNYIEKTNAQMAALTGKVSLTDYLPGSIAYEAGTATWNVKKAALTGVTFTVTNATNATPIVITTSAPHGFSNGDTVMIEGVLGNLAANGGWKAANVTSTTLELTYRSGANVAPGGAYTSGGTLQGISWAVISTTVAQPSPVTGACVTPGTWAHDTSAPFFTGGMYRCGSDLLWYKISNKADLNVDDDGHDFEAVFNANVGANKWRFTDIIFADAPIPVEPEYYYGPRNQPTIGQARGVRMGPVYNGWRGTDRITFDQTGVTTDLSGYYTPLVFTGYTTNFKVANSPMIMCSGPQHVYDLQELEMGCDPIEFTNSLGPTQATNNRFKVGGWCIFWAEPTTFVQPADVDFSQNYCEGVPEYAYGTPYYTVPVRSTGPVTIKTRQLAEWKTGRRVRIVGNTFDGLAYSVGGSAAAITAGTQTGFTNSASIDSNTGIVTVNAQRPLPLSLSANMKMMLFDSFYSKLVSDATNVTPIVITTTAPHLLKTGDAGIVLAGVQGNTAANGTWTVTRVSATQFSLDTSVGNGVYTTGGAVSATKTPGIYKIASVAANAVTLKNLDNSAYSGGPVSTGSICAIDMEYQVGDFDISNNTIINVPFVASIFGTSYSFGSICQPAPANRIRIANNNAYLWSVGQFGGTCGVNPTTCGVSVVSLGGLVDYLQVRNNTLQVDPAATSTVQTAFAMFDNTVTIGGTGLLVTQNLLNAENYGIRASDDSPATVGTVALGQRFLQGYNFIPNAMVRSGGSIATQPSGTVFPTVSQVKWLSSGQPQYSSSYLAYGFDIAALQRAQGLLTNPRVHVDADSVIVQFTSPVAGQHWYAEISSDGTTWTRTTSTGSGFEQSADVPAATGVAYDVRMIGPQGATALGRFRTH